MVVRTFRTDELRSIGPLIDVVLIPGKCVRELDASKGAQSVSIPARALVDTGSARTVVQQDIPARIGLTPAGTRVIATAGRRVECSKFTMAIRLPQLSTVVEGTVFEMPLEGQDIECLLGRDFLSHGLFIYDGTSDGFTFAM